jgi:hypothetical protein
MYLTTLTHLHAAYVTLYRTRKFRRPVCFWANIVREVFTVRDESFPLPEVDVRAEQGLITHIYHTLSYRLEEIGNVGVCKTNEALFPYFNHRRSTISRACAVMND